MKNLLKLHKVRDSTDMVPKGNVSYFKNKSNGFAQLLQIWLT